jgi:flavin reductase (DIM6/NTAB) family NADH-FMN oxidoreductase RutF
MFIAEVVNVQADERYINKETGAFSLASANPLAYCHGHYFELGESIGKFGFSVEKKKRKPNRE